LRALGTADPPEMIHVSGCDYRRVEIYKHDSWAATAVYEAVLQGLKRSEAGARRIICKFNRRQSAFGIPLLWLGRKLGSREAMFLRLFADVAQVPDPCGPVYVDGRPAETAVARCFIAGHPLGANERVGDDFFRELAEVLDAVHERGAAYVDLHKRENVLVGTDGRPHLIDFQVSFIPYQSGLGRLLTGWALPILQRMDDYHVAKLHRKCRPDQCNLTADELYRLMPLPVRIHRLIAQPLRRLRRALLVRLGVRTGRGEAQSEQFTEAALREPQRRAA
jgi:hypothetical protein